MERKTTMKKEERKKLIAYFSRPTDKNVLVAARRLRYWERVAGLRK